MDKNVRDYVLVRAIDSPAIAWAATAGPDGPDRTWIALSLRYMQGPDAPLGAGLDLEAMSIHEVLDAAQRWPEHTGLGLLLEMIVAGVPPRAVRDALTAQDFRVKVLHLALGKAA